MGGREWWEGGAVGRGRMLAQEGGLGRRHRREGWEHKVSPKFTVPVPQYSV